MAITQKLVALYRKYGKRSPYGWFGHYDNWQQALHDSTGYDAGNILQRVLKATLQVKEGKAVYERDGVLFDRVEYSWPLLAHLLWIANRNNGRLRAIDFGGSLGSTYFQNKAFLDSLPEVQWNVVEQANFTEAGKMYVGGDRLQFFTTIESCIQQQGIPDLLLLACTLPYIEKPYELLAELAQHRIPYLMIENTPFHDRPGDRLTVQRVSPQIYEAAYPCWLLDYEKVKAALGGVYKIHTEYTNDTIIYVDGRPVPYRGFLATLK